MYFRVFRLNWIYIDSYENDCLGFLRFRISQIVFGGLSTRTEVSLHTHIHYYEIRIDALYQSASVAHKRSLCDQQFPPKTGLWSSWQAGATHRCFQNLGLLNRFWFVSAIAFVLLRSEEGLDELWNEHFTLDVMELTLHAQGSGRELRTCSSLHHTVYSNWNCTLRTKTRFVVNVQWKQSRFLF